CRSSINPHQARKRPTRGGEPPVLGSKQEMGKGYKSARATLRLRYEPRRGGHGSKELRISRRRPGEPPKTARLRALFGAWSLARPHSAGLFRSESSSGLKAPMRGGARARSTAR